MQLINWGERSQLLERVAQLWNRWELNELKSLLSGLPEEQLFDEPELGYRLVTVLIQLRQVELARKLNRRLREHARQTGNERIYRRAVNSDGSRLFCSGRLQEAEQELLFALELASRADDFIVISATNTNLGNIASIRRDWDEAIVAYTRALIAAQRLGDADLIAGACQNLGLTYREMGLVRSSEAALEQAIEMFRAQDSRRVISIEVERALLRHVTGDTALAEATARRALAAARSYKLQNTEAECSRVIGIIVSTRSPEEALDWFHRAILPAKQMQNRLLEAEVLEEWAVLELRRDRPEEAADLAARSKEIYRSMGAERRAERVDERMA